jgi:hypothetical protein
MGGAVSGGAAVGDAAGAATYPVVLNVYDLTPVNNYLHWGGLGIFHSAVEGKRGSEMAILSGGDCSGQVVLLCEL